LHEVTVEARGAEFVVILGPSGCGKSTLFHIVAGLLRPTAGEVSIHGAVVTGEAGHVSYMPQRDNLMPWRSVLDNTILGLEVEGVPRREARKQAQDLCQRFGLGEFVSALPRELSGGMRQRAAFIRTMLFPRDVLLLDEPLGALDAQTRLLMQEWLLDVWGELRKTVLFITHDVDEAVFLADRVYVMSARPGQIVDEVAIDLPRPRDPSLRTSQAFVALRNRLLERIREETLKSFAGTVS
jgi:ABC-type nitrate/sulfonate/bicarbonate transport system ATPase subunit